MKLPTLPSSATRYVLVVDDEQSICWGLQRLLEELGHEVGLAASAEEAFDKVRQRTPDLVVLDVRLPGLDGLSAIPRFRELVGEVPIVVVTAFGNLETAVGAMQQGALDYVTKPFDLDAISNVLQRALARPPRPARVAPPQPGQDLQGECPAMQQVFKQIAIAAPSEMSVLVTGESGTGKELVARAIHRHSARGDKPFLTVNLAALSPNLIESELFGHVRGAFTGADSARRGLLELADGGTVFFDEIGDVPLNLQVKLLRVLEQREVVPVGDAQPRAANFRVIAATNCDLPELMESGKFRQDLFFRLAGFEIALPPLRQRLDDIPLLASYFLQTMPGGSIGGGFRPEALTELKRRSWPGNVRELKSTVQQAALLARGQAIGCEHLPTLREFPTLAKGDWGAQVKQAVRKWAVAQVESGQATGELYQQLLSLVEPPLFEVVCQATHQNRAAAAEMLGLHRATLRKKMSGGLDAE